MDEIKLLTKHILEEGRLDNIKQKYKQQMIDKEYDVDLVINLFSDNDPSGNNKYLDWMINQFVLLDTDKIIASSIIDPVVSFHQLQQQFKHLGKSVDINTYKTIGDLKTTVSTVDDYVQKKEFGKKAKKDIVRGYEDDTYLVVKPL